MSPHGTLSSVLDTGDMVQHSWNFCTNAGENALFTLCTAPLPVGQKSRHILMGLIFNHRQLSLFPPPSHSTHALCLFPTRCFFVIACLHISPVSGIEATWGQNGVYFYALSLVQGEACWTCPLVIWWMDEWVPLWRRSRANGRIRDVLASSGLLTSRHTCSLCSYSQQLHGCLSRRKA